MTTPTDPGDTGALRELLLQSLADYLAVSLTPGEPLRNAAAHRAMIAALDRVMTTPNIPDDCVVVRRDDLRHAVAAFDAIGTGPDDHEAYLRLRAAIGDEG